MLPGHHCLPLSPGMKVGILGGSFNPAHSGHLQMSELALRKLGLDRVVWMVSPQNPLKSRVGMEQFSDRFFSAVEVARHPKIVVSDFELLAQSPYTARSLTRLQHMHPRVHFVWIMGADNLYSIHHWDRWTRIFQAVPIAVIARPGYQHQAAFSRASLRYRMSRVDERDAKLLPLLKAPSWVYLRTMLNPVSSTKIRNQAASQGYRWPNLRDVQR